jgi:preprotein translocase, yajC subunit
LHGVIDNIDTVNKTVDLDCEGVILTFERAAIHHVVSESAPTNNEVYTDEVATEEE